MDTSGTKVLETADDIQERRQQVLDRYRRFKELSTVRRQKLEDSYRFQFFRRDADELEKWIQEKLQIASDENYKDPSNLQVRSYMINVQGLIKTLFFYVLVLILHFVISKENYYCFHPVSVLYLSIKLALECLVPLCFTVAACSQYIWFSGVFFYYYCPSSCTLFLLPAITWLRKKQLDLSNLVKGGVWKN